MAQRSSDAAVHPSSETKTYTMPQFVARCLEEIGLEGRCGMPLRDLFDAVDPKKDVSYRRYAWNVLRGMETQLSFHVMRPLQDHKGNASNSADRQVNRKPLIGIEEGSTPRRKRKWKTTLLNSPNGDSPAVKTRDDADRTPKRHKNQHLQPVLPSMRRIAARKQRRRLSDADCENRLDKSGSASRLRRRRQSSSDGSKDMDVVVVEEGDAVDDDVVVKEDPDKKIEGQVQADQRQAEEAIAHVKIEVEDAADETQWVLRSPRGFRLGEEVDVGGLSYDDAVTSNQDGVLGVVACEDLRLKYLGVQDSSSMDTISPQFDLLEIIGRAKERGENAAELTNSRLFGDSRKLHYLLDMLIGSNYVVKNIVTADQRRFNMVHLRRFASKFRASMVSPSATISGQVFPKEVLAQVIVGMMKARGERTCVFADIGRELGYGKRHQEQLRNYFMQQMRVKPSFPLQLFMARCKTGREYIGRKLWCLRLRNDLPESSDVSGRRRDTPVIFEEVGPDAISTGRPVIERGIMEQMFVAIEDREAVGATVPELRDMLGVPTFKLPYKLAQGLISNYNISVEQVVLGKSTMYRMFVPGIGNHNKSSQHGSTDTCTSSAGNSVGVRITRSSDKYSTPKGVNDTDDTGGQPQAASMMQASKGIVRASTIDRRRNYIVKRVQMEKIVSLHQLRTGLVDMERDTDVSIMDIRSVQRIIHELVEEKKITTMDITLPPKQVLQKANRKVKCAVLLGYQHSREAIREFMKTYAEEQQKKYQATIVDHDNDDYVVVTNRQKHRVGSVMKQIPADETYGQEVIKYSAASYKLARVGLVKLQKQSRRLGMFFGIMYKCRAFHLLIWNRAAILRDQDATVGGETANCCEKKAFGAEDDVRAASSPDGSKETIFALKDVLDRLTVKEYIQLVGVPELLSEQEEATVRSATSKGGMWDSLPQAIAEKLRGCEADRFSKIVRVLLELRLLHVMQDSSLSGLFNATDDFDSVVSRVAFATLSGGLFKIKRHVFISIKRGTSVLHRLPSDCTYAYAPGFSCKSKSEHFAGRVPLEFDFNRLDDVLAYWKSLRFLSVEGARLGIQSHEPNSVSTHRDGALIQSAPLPDHNIYTLKAWVPHSTTNTRNSTARAKAAAGPIQMLKRKRLQSEISAREHSSHKKLKVTKTSYGAISALMTPVDTSEAGVNKFREHVGVKKTRRTLTWSLEEDLKLIDMYLEQMTCRCFIEVPLALQRREERVAFRTTNLSRALISWKELGLFFKKKPIECMLRVNDLLEAPAIQARVERAKMAITEMKNPGGHFHEEVTIMQKPRLAALLSRALQVIMHERSNYHSVLADMLMSNWTESEVKLVWRYLWLAGIITRTYKANEKKDPKQRGYQLHSKIYEMKSLKIPHYLMGTFCEAAKYLSFVNENVDEATIVAEDSERYFEHDIEANISTGQAVVVLSSMISGFSLLVPSFVTPSKHSSETNNSHRSMAVSGLTGHLSRQWGGVFPEDFLKGYWTVRSVFGLSDRLTQAENIKDMEAFSDSVDIRSALPWKARPKRRTQSSQRSLSSWLSATLAEATGTGLALNELCEKYALSGIASSGNSKSSPSVLIQCELDSMIRKGSVLEVNGYDHVRFVLQEFADIWTLHPYHISSESTAEKVHFLFEKENTVVSRPWIHLDGSVNTRTALVLKRKVVNIVMCCPGIQDTALHKNMRKIVSLQDMRSLLEELMTDGVVYARVHRDSQPPAANIFGLPATRAIQDAKLVSVSPGELRYVNFSRDRLHYFPSVNCMELLGSEACDADLG